MKKRIRSKPFIPVGDCRTRFTALIKYPVTMLLLAGLLFWQTNKAHGQDSSHIRIALLTCTPGAELYSTFGHTAFRITDSSSVTDYVFNYGTFNFEDEGFYLKFIRGKLRYYLSAEAFPYFKAAYQAENRGITEQVLQLDGDEKLALMRALQENARETNKFYQYDFFFDNCTTRPRDMLVKYKKNHPGFNPVMPAGTTFRHAIHEYLDKNEKYWSKLGIDLLLGARTDAVMTTSQSQFLPDNLMQSLEHPKGQQPLVISTTNLYPVIVTPANGAGITPMLVFSLLFLVVTGMGFIKSRRVKNILLGFDGIFFFLTGMCGILLILMWVATDHSMTKDNYNLLWAWPINTIAAFYVRSSGKRVRVYFGLSAIALTLLLAAWFFLPQQMNNALIPLVLILLIRNAEKYFRGGA